MENITNKPIVIKVSLIGKKYTIKHKSAKPAHPERKAGWLPRRFLKTLRRQTFEDFWALKEISFEIKQGERVGIIGKNGAGKSTLLKLLSRITEPTEGRIELLGKISAMLEVGTGFNPELTGRENVYLNGAILGMTKSEVDRKFESIVEFSEIGNFIDTPVKRYSSGMYVRLAFAVASHLDPDILIIDEVLAVGDQKFRQKCMDRMNEIAQSNKTIICVSHQMNIIRDLCDRVLVLQNGKLIYDGDTEGGIALYLSETTGDSPSFFALGSLNRPAVSTNQAHLESFEFLNNLRRLASEDSLMKFKISWTAQKTVENVKLRMIIKFNDDSPVGIALSKELCNVKEGECCSSILSFDTSCLFPGHYKGSLALYESDATGKSLILDHLTDAISFETVELKNADKSIVFNHMYWGHARLNDIEITDSGGI